MFVGTGSSETRCSRRGTRLNEEKRTLLTVWGTGENWNILNVFLTGELSRKEHLLNTVDGGKESGTCVVWNLIKIYTHSCKH